MVLLFCCFVIDFVLVFCVVGCCCLAHKKQKTTTTMTADEEISFGFVRLVYSNYKHTYLDHYLRE